MFRLYSVCAPPGTRWPSDLVISFVYQTLPSAPTATSVMPWPVKDPEHGEAARHGPEYSV